MRRLAYLVALSLMALLLFVPTAGAQQGQNMTVNMRDNYFDQANITVPVGTTVTWVQSGNNPHTTTSYDGLWDSGILPGGSGQTSRSRSTLRGRTTTSAGPTRLRVWWAPLPLAVAVEAPKLAERPLLRRFLLAVVC